MKNIIDVHDIVACMVENDTVVDKLHREEIISIFNEAKEMAEYIPQVLKDEAEDLRGSDKTLSLLMASYRRGYCASIFELLNILRNYDVIITSKKSSHHS